MPILAALPAIASVVGIGSSIYGAVNQGNAVKDASQAQQQAAQQAAADYQPYLSAGQSALQQQMALLGLGGGTGAPGTASSTSPNYAAYVTGNPDILASYQRGDGKGASIDQFGQWHWDTFGTNENRGLTPFGSSSPGTPGSTPGASSQQAAIDQLKNSPLYQSLYHNGEQAVLANASATGGLRGGNTQHSLAQFGTDTLAQTIQQQLQNLGGISSLGENAAAGVGNGQLQAGQAQAGGILGSANANSQLANTIGGLPAALSGLFGGGVSTSTSNIAGSSPYVGAQSYAPLNLNTNVPMPVF